MRISRAGLLVLIGFTIPIIIELRTLLEFFDVRVSPAATALIGAVAIGAIVLWAVFPDVRSERSKTA